jgi:hypothetical protein
MTKEALPAWTIGVGRLVAWVWRPRGLEVPACAS